ncbi:GGDEF domain-containing protein [Aureimonas sp. SK2]|uniref:GGDEF domain-containing protein n=1 Tax=Aureimonas sp. SK2 TaxID=3015992 RepID=UPI00244418B3|nr:GGDEF domain-containing protein [Aureimonas sp. SK2]
MRADILAWSVPVLFAAFGFCFLLLSRLHRSLLWWSAGFLVAAVGFAITVLPTAPGSVVKPAGEDTLFLIALALANAAFAARAGRRPRWWLLVAIAALGSAGAAGGLLLFDGSVLHEVMAVQTACAGLMLLSAVEMRHDEGRLKPLLLGLCLLVAISLGFQNALLLAAPPEDLTVSNWRETAWGFVFQLNGAATGVLIATAVILTTTFDVIARLREDAAVDALTGALNRRGLEQAVDAMRRSAGPGRPLALILSDLDHFKSINDSFGHEAGDAVLCGFAALCAGLAGRGGCVARIGGEEFAIVLADADLVAARRLAERLRLAVAEVRWPGQLTDLRLTSSFGVVEMGEGEPPFEAVTRADALLYQAKSEGRDAIVVAAPVAASVVAPTVLALPQRIRMLTR